ncbi:hypothetical protein [Kribbella flavida]|uniref:hypothetical protein n=1 Tax=Kribbella flavida TaxID=182640 RepID=UPI0002DC13CC|nr:hypothetical protein [Kribbella flavida]
MGTTDRASILARLAGLSAANATDRQLADRLCEAGRLITLADGAWITVGNATPSGTTLCSTDAVATRLGNLQDVLGEGPCRDAI